MSIFGSLTPFLGKKGQVLKNTDFTACVFMIQRVFGVFQSLKNKMAGALTSGCTV